MNENFVCRLDRPYAVAVETDLTRHEWFYAELSEAKEAFWQKVRQSDYPTIQLLVRTTGELYAYCGINETEGLQLWMSPGV